MRMRSALLRPSVTLALLALAACGGGGGGGGGGGAGGGGGGGGVAVRFADASATNIPSLSGMCMDAGAADVDNDGDLDLVLAQEFAVNLLLRNDGNGVFEQIPGVILGGSGDNEDLRLADFDNDGDVDMISVHEDDGVHAFYLNDGTGVFTEMPGAIPLDSIANAVEVLDLNGDGLLDIILGNAGPNSTLLQQAGTTFLDDTVSLSFGDVGTTQDLLFFDADGDMDQDLFVANENVNFFYINDGNGVFLESNGSLPGGGRETREVDAADVDNDGDLDLILGNISFINTFDQSNQLFLNDGAGNFTDVSDTALAGVSLGASSFTIHFVDLDGDGDMDVVAPSNRLSLGGTVAFWLNDGNGSYTNDGLALFDVEPIGSLFDLEVFDANGDGIDDLYFCNRTGTDTFYLGQ